MLTLSDKEADMLTAQTAKLAEDALLRFAHLQSSFGLDVGASTFRAHRLGGVSWGAEERGLYAFLLAGVTPYESFEVVVARAAKREEWLLVQAPEEAHGKTLAILSGWAARLETKKGRTASEEGS